MPHTNKDQGGVEDTHNTRDEIEEVINTAILNLIFSGISIAQMKKIPDWLLESIEKNKTKFQETLHQELQKARGDWYVGQRLKVFKGDYVVVGISTMVYDEDCDGEPEWKITDQIQEVAIAQYYNYTSYQKPCWLKVTALQSELDQPNK